MKRIISSVLIAIIIIAGLPLTTVTNATTSEQLIDSAKLFTDITANKWYKQAVDYAVTYGIFKGTSSTTFSPNAKMTRAQFVQVLANVSGTNTKNNNVDAGFKDIKAGAWYTAAVKWAANAGIVNGVGGGKFAPDAAVTREQMCVMLVQFADYQKIVLNQSVPKSDFSDHDTISEWAKDAVYTCQRASIVSGKSGGRFDPKATGTRSESAQILMVFHSDYIFAKVNPNPEINPGGGGAVVVPQPKPEVDESIHISGAISNDNGFIPDDGQAIEKSERRANEISMYNIDKNPLINRDRQNNQQVLPSFNIDETGFVRSGTTLKDLKGKTLMFYTSDVYPAWSYRDNKDQTIDEWKWFDQLKGTIGLSIKKTVSGHLKSCENALKDMNAGKQCDVIYSSHVTYPASLCISRSITELININSEGSSPGVCKRTMDICKWGNTYRVVAPIGVVDVLWYNQTLTQELGLSDPHKMWEADKWDWDAYSKFLKSVPEKTTDGKPLTAMVHWRSNTSYIWPATTGTPHIYVDANAKVPTIISNWGTDSTTRAWSYITDLYNTVNFAGPAAEDSPGQQKEHNGLYEGTTVMSGTMYTQVYHDTEYSKHVNINWVPYPMEKARTFAQMQAAIDNKYANSLVKPDASHDGIAQFMGFGMLLPKKTVKENNVDIALKFMELWATRFTEAYFDNLNVFEYYNFNYKQRKQYFDFVTQNVVFGLPMNDYTGTDFGSSGKFFECFMGDPSYNVKTEATKVSNLVYNYIIDSLKYGQ